MKRFTKIRTLVPILFLLLGTIPLSAAERPFALSGSGVATLITNEQGMPIGAIPTGSGTATHLGQWTVTGNVAYTPDANGVLHSSGDATITASNGDKVQIKIEGVLDPVAGMDQGLFHIVGGTGRFEGATGDANFVVQLNPLTGGFNLTVVGKINY
jgi:ribosomal protein L21E